jgi:hypothetical protein
MDLLSEKNREKFKSAALRVSTLVKSGSTPESAVRCVIESEKFTPEMAKRLIECHNTSMTLHQFRSSEALDDKVASVPLLNAEEIVASIFPPQEKAASSPDPFYRKPVRNYITGEEDSIPLAKAASIETEKAPESNKDKLRSVGVSAKKAAATRGRGTNLAWDFQKNINDAAIQVDRPTSPEFAEVETRVLSKFGSIASGYMDALADTARVETRGKATDKTFMTDFSQEPFKTIAAGISIVKEAAELIPEMEKAEKEFEDASEQLLKTASKEELGVLERWLDLFKPNIQKKAEEEGDLLPFSKELIKRAKRKMHRLTLDPASISALGKAFFPPVSPSAITTSSLKGELLEADVRRIPKETEKLELGVEKMLREEKEAPGKLEREQKEERRKERKSIREEEEAPGKLEREEAREQREVERAARERKEKKQEEGFLGLRGYRTRDLESKVKKKQLAKLRSETSPYARILGLGRSMEEMTQRAEELAQVRSESIDLADVFTPSHEFAINKVKAQALLNQLLTSDPIIKGYPPEEVIEAFNEIVRLRPEVLDHKPLAVGLLRQLLERAQLLDPMTVVKLLEDQSKKEQK